MVVMVVMMMVVRRVMMMMMMDRSGRLGLRGERSGSDGERERGAQEELLEHWLTFDSSFEPRLGEA